MATESVADEVKYVLEAEVAKRIQWMLLDGIQAKNALDVLTKNIEDAADHGYTAKTLLAVKPDPIDLCIGEAAEMVQLLSVLPTGKEG